ncbi:unnamed protein product, partial [Gulo gulo]
ERTLGNATSGRPGPGIPCVRGGSPTAAGPRVAMWRLLARAGAPLLRAPVSDSWAVPPASAGLKTLLPVPTFEDVSIPEKPKLRFVERVPLVPKVRREPKNLRDIRGPSTEATEFTEGSFAILGPHQ